ALRSSRSEPFGDQFLREAARRTMRGDVAGLRAAFVAAAAALRARALPASAVATRARVTKPPEAYLQSRAAHREAPYDALLAAGRPRRPPAERFRSYRARAATYVLLPDEPDDASFFDRRDYAVDHSPHVLVSSSASRLRKAFAPEDFARIFQLEEQLGLFDR